MFEEKLIEAVIKHPCIYDKKYADFRNKYIKDKSWKSIQSEVGESDEKCRTRWKTLRERFVKEMAKLAMNEETKPWKFTSAMSFMKDFIDTKLDGKRSINFEEILINEVKKYKSLYEKEDVNYKNKRIKEKNWTAISSAVSAKYEDIWSEFESELREIDINELCRLRWQSLHKRYVEEYFKVIQYGRENESTWMYTGALSFLKDFIDENDGIGIGNESVQANKSRQQSPSPSRKITFEEILIRQIKNYPCIYDRSDLNYRHRDVKEEAWLKIACAVCDIMGCNDESKLEENEEKCRSRWRSLRERYVKEYLKMIQYGVDYKSNWGYAETMSFMEKHIDQKTGIADLLKEKPKDFEEILINEVKKYKCIYDKRHPDYRNKSIKEDCWAAMSVAVREADDEAWSAIEADAEPEEICRLRWKTLRERYVKEYIKSVKYGTAYQIIWKYFDAMFFMKDYIEINKTEMKIPHKTKSVAIPKRNNTRAANFEEILIKEVKKYPCIYDQDNPDRRRECIKAAWVSVASDIIDDYGYTYASHHAEQEEKCRARWKTLRERYVKEYTKMNKLDKEYTSNWRYTEAMSYMQDCIDRTLYVTSEDQNTTFSRNFEANLIHEVKTHPCLYNPNDPDYRRKENYKTAWAMIASALKENGFSFGDQERQEAKCRTRWKTLRERYLKECRKTNRFDAEYKSSWKYMEAMSFTQGIDDQRQETEDISLMQDTMDQTWSDEEDLQMEHSPEKEPSPKIELSPKMEPSPKKTEPKISVTKNFEDNLIEEVKKYACLYDKHDDCFGNKEAKTVAWNEIAFAIGISGDQCRARWSSLRTQFINELKSETDNRNYNSNWRFYDTMSFIKKLVTSKNEKQDKKNMYCRTCMKQIANDSGPISENFDIFETFNLCEKLSQCTSLVFETNDNYPNSVCLKCYEKTLEFYQFRLMCRDSMETFARKMEDRSNFKLEYDSEDTLDNDHSSSSKNNESSKEENLDDGYRMKSYDNFDNSSEVNFKSENEEFMYEDPLLEHMIFKDEVRSKIQISPLQNLSPSEHLAKNLSVNQQIKKTSSDNNSVTQDEMSEDEKSFPDHSVSANVEQQEIKCKICGEEFNFQYRLRVHMRKHTLLDRIKCRKCFKRFPNPSALTKHRCFGDSQMRFFCDVEGCALKFATQNLLELHKKKHAGVWKNICPYCGVTKPCLSALNRHINIHTFAKKYPCHICSKPFKTSTSRIRHINGVHKKIKPFSCRFCDRSFELSFNRDHHEMGHQGIKPYSCDICDKKFKWKLGLKTHNEIVHCGAEPHVCEICGKEYKWLGSLTKHVQTHKQTTEVVNEPETECSNDYDIDESIEQLLEDDTELVEFSIESYP